MISSKLTLVLPAAHCDTLSNYRQFYGSILFIFTNTANNSLQSWKYLYRPVLFSTNCIPRDKLQKNFDIALAWVISGHRKTSSTLFNKSLLISSAEKGADILLIMHEMHLLWRSVVLRCEKSWKITFCHCLITDESKHGLYHAVFLCYSSRITFCIPTFLSDKNGF